MRKYVNCICQLDLLQNFCWKSRSIFQEDNFSLSGPTLDLLLVVSKTRKDMCGRPLLGQII